MSTYVFGCKAYFLVQLLLRFPSPRLTTLQLSNQAWVVKPRHYVVTVCWGVWSLGWLPYVMHGTAIVVQHSPWLSTPGRACKHVCVQSTNSAYESVGSSHWFEALASDMAGVVQQFGQKVGSRRNEFDDRRWTHLQARENGFYFSRNSSILWFYQSILFYHILPFHVQLGSGEK